MLSRPFVHETHCRYQDKLKPQAISATTPMADILPGPVLAPNPSSRSPSSSCPQTMVSEVRSTLLALLASDTSGTHLRLWHS
jgi:hypothetical protein